MGKRLFDILGAAVALIVCMPFFAVAALAIRLDSPGPVFFRQQRVGRGGRPFRIHKFRTMAADAGRRGPSISVEGDPRVTRVGRWLRHSKLDELPQLLDVLAGRMSLVGPRPELPQYVSLYPPALRETLLSVRPGLTDPVSLSYADEGRVLAAAVDPEREYRQVLMPAKLRDAAAYVETATLWSDCRVLARTLALLFAR